MRIYLIDDDALLRRSLRRALPDHEVDEASSGEQAIEHLRHESTYDVVLCDVMMPGMTGLDVFAWIEREQPGLVPHFGFMTGSLATPQTQALLRGSARPRVEKPIPRADLLALVERLGKGVQGA